MDVEKVRMGDFGHFDVILNRDNQQRQCPNIHLQSSIGAGFRGTSAWASISTVQTY